MTLFVGAYGSIFRARTVISHTLTEMLTDSNRSKRMKMFRFFKLYVLPIVCTSFSFYVTGPTWTSRYTRSGRSPRTQRPWGKEKLLQRKPFFIKVAQIASDWRPTVSRFVFQGRPGAPGPPGPKVRSDTL